MAYKLGIEIGTIKNIDGEDYILSMDNGEKQLWLPVSGLKVEKQKCSGCGYEGDALDRHHVDGRKNSDRTILLCANCHRELHAREGYK